MREAQVALTNTSRAWFPTPGNVTIRRRLAEARLRYDGIRGPAHRREVEREYDLDYIAQAVAPMTAVAATRVPAEVARPTEDEENIDGVAALFNAVEDEHNRQRQQAATNERKHYM